MVSYKGCEGRDSVLLRNFEVRYSQRVARGCSPLISSRTLVGVVFIKPRITLRAAN